ncbi:hypothetical protein SNARM312S_03728 [Streptomyces narbonensis]
MRTKPYWTLFGVARGGCPTRRPSPRRGGLGGSAGGSRTAVRRPAVVPGGPSDEGSRASDGCADGGEDSGAGRARRACRPDLGAGPRRRVGEGRPGGSGRGRPGRWGRGRAAGGDGAGRRVGEGCLGGSGRDGPTVGGCRTSMPRPPRPCTPSPARRCSPPWTRAGPIRPGCTGRGGGPGFCWTRRGRPRRRRWGAVRTSSCSLLRGRARFTPESPGPSRAVGVSGPGSSSRRSSTPPSCTRASGTRRRAAP